MEQYRRRAALITTLAASVIITATYVTNAPNEVQAQDKAVCATVKDCAQAMVVLANDLKNENAALLKRIVALETELTNYKAEDAKALEARIARLRTGADSNDFPGGNGYSGNCAAGKFMVGARWQVDTGGPHGIMSWFGPICRDLP